MGTPLCHPVYNEVLGMTNDFLLPATVKYMKKEPRYREQILPYPWPFVIVISMTDARCASVVMAYENMFSQATVDTVVMAGD